MIDLITTEQIVERTVTSVGQEGEVITVDGRCGCYSCEKRTGNIYRMVGSCRNCGLTPILMLFREGDIVAPLNCPTCGVKQVYSLRLAWSDEIPAEPDRSPR